MRLLVILSCLILFLVTSTFSYGSDTTDIRLTTTSDFESNFSGDLVENHVDTILQSFYQFEYDGRNLMSSLGNPGLSYSSMLFKKLNFGFVSGESAFDDNFKDFDDHKIYFSSQPFARVSYRDGAKKYQDFDVLFTENLNKRLNFTISFNTQSSTGFYINQSTVTKRFDFQNSFKTRSGKYGYFLNFKVRNGTAGENGGIKSDSLYTELIKLAPFDVNNNKLKVQVWQEKAINTYDYRKLYFSQFIQLFESKSDTNHVKQVDFGLVNHGGFDDIWYRDSLIDSSYYDRFGIDLPDSGDIRDQSKLFYFKNNGYFKLENILGKSTLLIGGEFNYYNSENLQRNERFNESSIYLKAPKIELGDFVLSGILQKGISGYNKSGYNVDAQLKLPTNDSVLSIIVGGHLLKGLADYKYSNYGGNYIHWESDFDYSTANGVDAKIVVKPIKVTLSGVYESNSGYVYFGSDSRPIQRSNSFYRYAIQLKKELVLGKYHFDFTVINQGVEEGTPVNLAEWVGVISFYYQRNLFKDAMEIRYGIDYWQNSSYYAQAYAPFTRSFVYQDNYQVGDYPYLNFYISARIKSAQGFVNFQNIGQFIFSENYMMVPDYALQDFGISFGLRWDFYN